ncbi:sulfatase family protein [Thalassotalea sp. PLHSN55]|uniref:sulfatase family protein n=1 Tax=Thalassotalea sp. PLHSN55 TaxID=3435888 RepID=UPI003F828CF6
MKTRFYFIVLGLIHCCIYSQSLASTNSNNLEKPLYGKQQANIIIIVADQMRRASMGFWQQSRFKHALNGKSDYVITPNLDNLANQGVVFNHAISNYPLCSPFRGMLLSGLFPHKNGVTNNTRTDRPNTGLKTEVRTLTNVLANEGYNTALVGKGHWHNNHPLFDGQSNYVGKATAPGGHFFKGTRYDTYIPPGPARQSIEYWYQSIGHNHNNPVVYTNDKKISNKNDGQPFYPKRYSAVDQANVIIDYINNSHEQRNQNKPFALLWTMDPPHSPYKNLTDTDEQIYNQFYKDVAIETLLNRSNVNIATAEKYARFHFSMITLIDREIGRVMASLQNQGLDENTLVIFTADHGEMMGSHSKMSKNSYYEESLSIPLIISYPKKLKPHLNDLLISVPDFMPTILALVDLKEKIPNNLDGIDRSELLISQSRKNNAAPNASLYYGKANEIGVRTHQYTYVLNANGQLIALFDNKKDPYQLQSLTLEQIPEQDSKMLKQALGMLLSNIDHPWAVQQKYPSMVTYP